MRNITVSCAAFLSVMMAASSAISSDISIKTSNNPKKGTGINTPIVDVPGVARVNSYRSRDGSLTGVTANVGRIGLGVPVGVSGNGVVAGVNANVDGRSVSATGRVGR